MTGEKRAANGWKIHRILQECDSVDEALAMAVDAVAILAASQFDTATERRLIIDMCIARLKNHQENADKIQRAF